MMPRLPTIPWRSSILLALALVLLPACAHQRIATESLEREGCDEIVLTKSGEGFVLEARCGQQHCTGTIVVHGTRWKNETDTSMSCS